MREIETGFDFIRPRADHRKLKELFAALKQEQRDRDTRAKMSEAERLRFDQQRRHR
ncbi:MAG: hypothetical protein P8K76_03100 [Candidatus Binatia bacterium]|nr:hypothetical protein [Candidatus Binatia bacterium]